MCEPEVFYEGDVKIDCQFFWRQRSEVENKWRLAQESLKHETRMAEIGTQTLSLMVKNGDKESERSAQAAKIVAHQNKAKKAEADVTAHRVALSKCKLD